MTHSEELTARRRRVQIVYLGCFSAAFILLVTLPVGPVTSFALGIMVPGTGFSSGLMY